MKAAIREMTLGTEGTFTLIQVFSPTRMKIAFSKEKGVPGGLWPSRTGLGQPWNLCCHIWGLSGATCVIIRSHRASLFGVFRPSSQNPPSLDPLLQEE